jgi:hypothetical protein
LELIQAGALSLIQTWARAFNQFFFGNGSGLGNSDCQMDLSLVPRRETA